MNIATDNASTNDVLVETLIKYLLSLYGVSFHKDNHVHCANHVISLTVQAMTSSLGEADDAEDGEDLDDFLQTKDAPLYYNADEDSDQRDLEEMRDKDIDDKTPEDFLKDLEREEVAAVDIKSAIKRVCAW